MMIRWTTMLATMIALVGAFIAPSTASAQTLLSGRLLQYFSSAFLGSEVTDSVTTDGRGIEIGLNLSNPESNLLFGGAVILEEFTTEVDESGEERFSLQTIGFLGDLRYRFSKKDVQPYLGVQVGISHVSVDALSSGDEEELSTSGLLIVPNAGVLVKLFSIVMLDVNVRSHRTFASDLLFRSGFRTEGYNGVGVALGVGFLF